LFGHVSATDRGHLQGAHMFIDMCSLCVNLFGHWYLSSPITRWRSWL